LSGKTVWLKVSELPRAGAGHVGIDIDFSGSSFTIMGAKPGICGRVHGLARDSKKREQFAEGEN